MGSTSYCLLLATVATSISHECPESLSDRPSILRNAVVPWLCFALLHLRAVQFWDSTLSSTQKKYVCAGLLMVSWILYYGSYLKFYEVLSKRASTRADVLENGYKLDEAVTCKCMEPHEGIFSLISWLFICDVHTVHQQGWRSLYRKLHFKQKYSCNKD